MKRLFFIIACLAGFAMTNKAQIRIGVKGGLNICNQVNPYIHTYSIKPSYDRGQSLFRMNGGLFLDVILSDRVFLRTQLAIAGLGYKLHEGHDQSGYKTNPAQEFHMSYLVVPVQIIYSFDSKIGKIWAGAGPYSAIFVDGRIKLPYSTGPISTGNGPPAEFKNLDFGISPTVGLKLNSGLLFGIDYNIGLSDVSVSVDRSRNVYWSLYFGYILKNHR
jgi:Outer membrane protein beta-barrel domain